MSNSPSARRSRMAITMAAAVTVFALVAGCSSKANTAGPTTTPSSPHTTAPPSSTSGTGSSTVPDSSTSATTATTVDTTTTTTEPIVTAGGIVKVANSSKVNGAAKMLTEELAALGFTTRKPTNGAGIDDDLKVSKIYAKPGAEAAAQSIARLLGGIAVTRMPTPAWITGGTAGLGDATVLVMLGHDLAGKKLAQMSG